MYTDRLTGDDRALLREIGERIRKTRAERVPRYTRKAMADDLGYSMQWLLRAEMGAIVNLSVLDVFYVAKHLGVSPEFLLGLDTGGSMRQRMRTAGDFRRLFADQLAADTLFAVWWAIRKARREALNLHGEIAETSQELDSDINTEEEASVPDSQ